MSVLKVVLSDRIRIRKDLLVGFVAAYGALMLVAYALSNQASINTRTLIPQIYGIITFILVLHYFTGKDIDWITSLYAVTGTIASLYGIVQLLGLDPLEWMIPGYDARGAIVSFFGHKNYFATFLLLAIPMGGIFMAQVDRFSLKIIAGVSVLIMITGLIISNSRGAIIAFVTASIISAGMYAFQKYKTNQKRLKIKATLGIVLFLALIVVVFIPEKTRREFSHLDDASSVRFEYYQAGWEIIGRHPIFGVGPGNFVIAYPLNETHKTLTHNPNKVLSHVHNDFLETAVEYGLFGLLVYGSIIGIFYLNWVSAFLKTRDPKAHLPLICVFCAVTGYLIYSPFTVAGRYMSSTFNFWFVMGLGYLLISKETDPNTDIRFENRLRTNQWMRIPAGICILLLFGMGIARTVKSYRSDVYLKRAALYSSKGRHDPALWNLNKAVALRPNSVEAFYQRGYVHFQKNLIDRALADYKIVFTLAPNYVNTAFNTASCYYRKRDWINAIRMAELSHRSFPDYEPPLLMLANCYYYIRQPRKALYYCNLLIEKPGSQAKAHRLKKRLEKILKIKP